MVAAMVASAHTHGRNGRRRLAPLDVAGSALGFWGLFAPRPYELCISLLALAPLICIAAVARAPDRLTLNSSRRRHGRKSLGVLFLVSGLALAARGLTDVHIVDWRGPLAAAGGLGMLMAAAAFAAEAEFRSPVWAVALPLFALGWGWGVAVEADSLLDPGPWATYPATVVDKTFSRGRGATTYHVSVTPGSVPGVTDRLTVAGGLYHRTPIGGKLCVEVSPGRLGWPWYEAKACS